jgi:molecular chaperone DnaJ
MAGGFGSPGGFGGGGGGFGGPGGGTFRVEDMGNLGDLFGGIFGGRGAGGRRARGPQRGADVETELHLSFKDAVHGVTTSVNVPQEATCHTCNGSGAKPGTSAHTCERCGGRGVLDDNQGLFSLATICPVCNGRGTVVDDPCPTCHGSGMERRVRKIRVRIPPGVEDGQRIRVKGRGAPGQGSGPAGDLYVVVRVGRSKLFGRRGRDLTLTVPVTFPEATLGTTVSVPTLDGTVTVRVPAGTASGKTLRVRGRGVPAGGSKNGKPGDLLVKIEVSVPTNLTDEQRSAVENLAAVSEAAPRTNLEG